MRNLLILLIISLAFIHSIAADNSTDAANTTATTNNTEAAVADQGHQTIQEITSQSEAEAAGIHDLSYMDSALQKLDIGESDLAGATEFAYSFWFRWSFLNPTRIPMGTVRSSWFGVAGLTEQQDYCAEGSRKLAIFINPYEKSDNQMPIYSFHTYNNKNDDPKKPEDVSQSAKFDLKDNDYAWNWFYFGYSVSKQQAFAYIKFGSSSTPQALTFDKIVHNSKLNVLKLILGRCDSVPNANGQFFDINFDFTEGCYMNSASTIETALKSVPIPINLYAKEQTLNIIKQEVFQMVQATPKQIKYNTDFQGAQEYSAFGWFKWNATPNRDSTHAMFRLSINPEDLLGDKKQLGDRVLMLAMGQGFLEFSTYNYGIKEGDNPCLIKRIEFETQILKWFFVYFGHSISERKSLLYVRFSDGKEFQETINALHFVPKFMGIHVGGDPFYKNFNGEIQLFRVQIGKGAYRTQLKDIIEEEKSLFNLDIEGADSGDTKKGYISIGRMVPSTKDVSQHDFIHYLGDENKTVTYKEEAGKIIVTNNTANDSSQYIVKVEEDFDYILNKESKEVANKEKGISAGNEQSQESGQNNEQTQTQQHKQENYENENADKAKLVVSSDLVQSPLKKEKANNAASSEYSFHFWARFSFTSPNQVDDPDYFKKKCYSMARITEGSHDKEQLGDRNLAVFICSDSTHPLYYFSTYDTETENIDYMQWQPMRLDDLDGSWNFIYMGYSKKDARATAFAFYSVSGTSNFYEWNKIKHNDKPEKLEFLLGGYLDNRAMNGHFFDAKLCAATFGCYYPDQAAVLEFMHKKVDRPPAFKIAEKGQKEFLKEPMNFTTEVHKADGSYINFKNQIQYAQEYCVFGWAKYNSEPITFSNTQFQYNALFRLSLRQLNDQKKGELLLGDNVLSVLQGEQSLRFSTYTWDEESNLDRWNDVEIEDDEPKNWFFVYYGYSKQKLSTFLYIKFANREIFNQIKGVRHFIPNTMGLYLGVDPYFDSFQGSLKNFVFQFGKGSYLATGFNHILGPEFISKHDKTQKEADDNKKLMKIDQPNQQQVGKKLIKQQAKTDEKHNSLDTSPVTSQSEKQSKWQWLSSNKDFVFDKNQLEPKGTIQEQAISDFYVREMLVPGQLWAIKINQLSQSGFVCMGLFKNDQISEIVEHPQQSHYPKSVSACTTNYYFNHWGSVLRKEDVKYKTSGLTYYLAYYGYAMRLFTEDEKVDVLFELDDETVNFIPWIEFRGENSVKVEEMQNVDVPKKGEESTKMQLIKKIYANNIVQSSPQKQQNNQPVDTNNNIEQSNKLSDQPAIVQNNNQLTQTPIETLKPLNTQKQASADINATTSDNSNENNNQQKSQQAQSQTQTQDIKVNNNQEKKNIDQANDVSQSKLGDAQNDLYAEFFSECYFYGRSIKLYLDKDQDANFDFAVKSINIPEGFEISMYDEHDKEVIIKKSLECAQGEGLQMLQKQYQKHNSFLQLNVKSLRQPTKKLLRRQTAITNI